MRRKKLWERGEVRWERLFPFPVSPFTIILVSLLFTSCMNLPFKKAKANYKQISDSNDLVRNCQSSISEFNDYIQTGSNPALKVRSKLLRSNCYYRMGKKEMADKNYHEAASYLFLSNSDKADTLLDNCYFRIANDLIESAYYSPALIYFDFIINNLSNSNFLPQILYEKMKIQFEINDLPKQSYSTYKFLKNKFPHNPYTNSAAKIVDEYMPAFIEETESVWESGNFSQAIEELLAYLEYPADYQNKLKETVADVFLSWGNKLIKEDSLDKAEEKLYEAKSYNPNLQNTIQEKLDEICTIYIEKGDVLLADRQIDEAINAYQSPLKIFSNFPTSISKIKHANQVKANIKQAKKIVKAGNKSFADEKYPQALQKYKKAYEFDSTDKILNKILLAQRWIRITDEPKKFALDIIKNFEDGILIKEIQKVENEAKSIYSLSEITISKWLVMRSTAQNSYEVRLTITTPNENHIFFWIVKLETGKIIPLNTTTEEMMQ